MPAPTRAIGQEILPRTPRTHTPAQAPPKRPLNPATTHRSVPPTQQATPAITQQKRLQPAPPAQVQMNSRPQPHPPLAKKRSSRLLQTLQVPLIIIVGALLGVFVQSAIVGQVIILLYGAAALIWRIESRTTFTIAVMTIGITAVLLFTQNSTMLAHNFASYSFMLLLIGIICMSREVREQKQLLVKKRGPERFKQYLKSRQKLQKAQRV